MISVLLTTGRCGNVMHLMCNLGLDRDLFVGFHFVFEIQQYSFFNVFKQFFECFTIGKDTVSDCAGRPISVFIGSFKSYYHDVPS